MICRNTLDDYADDVLDFTIQQRHHHLIKRPLQHTPLPKRGNTITGIVVMEFGRTIYRQDVSVTMINHSNDTAEKYSIAVQEAGINIRKCVMRDIEFLDSGRFEHDA